MSVLSTSIAEFRIYLEIVITNLLESSPITLKPVLYDGLTSHDSDDPVVRIVGARRSGSGRTN